MNGFNCDRNSRRRRRQNGPFSGRGRQSVRPSAFLSFADSINYNSQIFGNNQKQTRFPSPRSTLPTQRLPSEFNLFSPLINSNSQRFTNNQRQTRFPSPRSTLPTQRTNLKNSQEILNAIISDNDILDQLQANGDLLVLLNSSGTLSRVQVHHLLSSFNQYKSNGNSSQYLKKLFNTILESSFIPTTLQPMGTYYFQNMATSEEIRIMVLFITSCLELFPRKFTEKMALLYPCVLFACQQLTDPGTKELFDMLKESFDAAKNVKAEQSLCLATSSLQLSDRKDFRTFSVIPQDSDIFCLNTEVELQPNKFGGEDVSYESVDNYLATQFCLLKEDFVRPLRDGIAAIREDMLKLPNIRTKNLQIRLYENVTVDEMYTCKNGLVYRVIFDVSKFRKIDWKKARRFIYGSLLCFTNNFFDTIYFASVVDGDAKNLAKGILVVQFNVDPILEVLENNQFMMIETKNLFEAYRHVLTKLQTFTVDTLPFQENIVFGDNISRHPAYMNVNELRAIEKEGSLDQDFDESQCSAFVNALKSSLSLIQGPPGTGKTYVGLKIIKYLVNHFQTNTNNIGPILVVCYTNHALDQFLQDIIQAIGTEHVIRVGGRSKLDIMKDCNISALKWKWVRKKAFPNHLFKRGIRNRQEIECAEENLIRKYVKVKNYGKKMLSYNDINCCMGYNDIRYFEKNKFDVWIKGGDELLNETFDGHSAVKQTIVREVSYSCIEEVIREMATNISVDLLGVENAEEDNAEAVIVEDPDDILNDQRFLDEDRYLLKNVNKYRNLYDDFEGPQCQDADVDCEGFKYVANTKLIKNKLKGTKPLSEEEYKAITSLDVEFNVRLRLYKYWMEKYRIIQYEEYKFAKSQFDELNKNREEIYFEEYIEIMKSVKVIGMTTTGAARYGSVLDRVGCRVVVIEEAAEVMESHVVCSLSQHCDQLIMIGDHKQLRPKVDVYDLEINYNLGISLFERLVTNNCKYVTLQYQHRMRPEISRCVKPIYPELKDSDNVFDYDPVSGMSTNIYFFNHNSLENESIETSYKNDFEAEFVSKFCEYLIKNGNLPRDITVLTLYSGQLYNMSNRMKGQTFRGIRICVIDNFQGEENEIIVMSLVRSNVKGAVGFVKSENRLCVALSRAKRGFYILGNFNMLCNKIPLLSDIIENHLDRTAFGSKLPLMCLMHPDQKDYFITNLNDFSKKGCPAKCGMELKCGHVCTWDCHRENPSHKAYKCNMPCEKQCDRDLHGCQLKCSQKCRCDQNIILKLRCGHQKEVVCDEKMIKCIEICEKIMACDHRCVRMCHEMCICEVQVQHVAACTHVLEDRCGTDFSKLNCHHDCDKKLACGHICRNECWQKCVCQEKVNFTLPCSHEAKLQCGTDLLKVQCRTKVQKTFRCGHVLQYECFKNVDKCLKKCSRKLKCGHVNNVTCSQVGEDGLCKYVCMKVLSCGHLCQGGCEDCYKNRFHVRCSSKCQKQLKCGHKCDSVCHPGCCPPCEKPCVKYCTHSKCLMKCGDICNCTVCKIECSKMIKCTQCAATEKCSKLCAEACPKLCRRCSMKQHGYQMGDIILMEPCYCTILKTDLQPELLIKDCDVTLVCQNCNRNLRWPYRGPLLIHFKKKYSSLFHVMDEIRILKWDAIFDELVVLGLSPPNSEEVIKQLTTEKICRQDIDISDECYTKFQDIIKVCINMAKVSHEGNIGIYSKKIKKSLCHLIMWLNPFNRSLNPQEMALLDVEMSIVSLYADILSLLSSGSTTDYALIHKPCFDILDSVDNIINIEDMKTFYEKLKEIKDNLNNTKESTKDEEELVDRIINARDIYKEFNIEKLSVEEKVKEIKKLIWRCHPDKNKSIKANEAVKILLSKKELLE